MSNTERIKVRPGQVWADNDPRSTGRTIKVVDVNVAPDRPGHHSTATCEVLTMPLLAERRGTRSTVGRRFRIRLDRFRPTSTGYRLISQPKDVS